VCEEHAAARGGWDRMMVATTESWEAEEHDGVACWYYGGVENERFGL
jgi:hypothetical protein